MKIKLPLITLLIYIYTGTAFAQSTVTFSETFTSGAAPTATQKTHWTDFKALLTPRCYSRVVLKGSANTTGFIITNSNDVSTIAANIRNNVSFQLASGGHNWQYCSNDLRIDGPAVTYCGSCNSGDCLRSMQNNENWGGLNGNTCAAGTQTITLEFTYNDAFITQGSIVSICEGDSVTLSTAAGLSYLWSNGATTQSIVVDTSGTFSVVVHYVNGCIDTSAVTAVTLNTRPSVTTCPDTIICTGDSVHLTCGGTNGVTFQWTPSTGLSNLNSINPVAKPILTTTYTLTVMGINGCINYTTVKITVNPLPSVSISPADTTICSGSVIQLWCGNGGIIYRWSPDKGLTDSTVCNPLCIANSTITYSLSVTDANGCTNHDTVRIAVDPGVPTPGISCSGDTIFCSFDPTYTSYQWYVDTIAIQGATNPFYVRLQSGNYNVLVTNQYGCSATNWWFLGCDPNDIENYTFGNPVFLSPNPATSQLSIHSPSLKEATILIINILGQETSLPAPLQRRGEEAAIYVGDLPPGIYFVQVIGDKERWVGRFVKE